MNLYQNAGAAALAIAQMSAIAQDTTCSAASCPAGSKVVTVEEPGVSFYFCPTKELSEYTAVVMGMVVSIYSLSNRFPNISPITGEPELKGLSAEMVTSYRQRAGVRTFDQAVAICKTGRKKIKAVIDNASEDSISAWVSVAGRPSDAFWVPMANLAKRK